MVKIWLAMKQALLCWLKLIHLINWLVKTLITFNDQKYIHLLCIQNTFTLFIQKYYIHNTETDIFVKKYFYCCLLVSGITYLVCSFLWV